MRFRRRLYPRGNSHETTIPKPLLFALNPKQRHDVIFEYDPEKKRWFLSFEERGVRERKRPDISFEQQKRPKEVER